MTDKAGDVRIFQGVKFTARKHPSIVNESRLRWDGGVRGSVFWTNPYPHNNETFPYYDGNSRVYRNFDEAAGHAITQRIAEYNRAKKLVETYESIELIKEKSLDA
jgi:hypothetical protein